MEKDDDKLMKSHKGKKPKAEKKVVKSGKKKKPTMVYSEDHKR